MLLRPGIETRYITVSDEPGKPMVLRLEGKTPSGEWKPIGFDPDDPDDVAQVKRNMQAFKRRLMEELDGED